jgi:Flp pilus assembly protein TadB
MRLFKRKKKRKEEPKKKESKKPEEKQEEKKKPVQEKADAQKKEQEEKPKHKRKKVKIKLPEFLPRMKIIPRFYQNWVERQLYFSGSKRSPSKFIWISFIISVLISGGVGLLLRRLMIYVTPAAFLILFAFFNFMIILSVDRRSRFVCQPTYGQATFPAGRSYCPQERSSVPCRKP